MDHKRTSTHIRPRHVLIEPAVAKACSLRPHPLDFDWRFTDPTVLTLWRLARELADPGEGIVLLGVPTLAVRAAEGGIWEGPIVLLDRNRPEITGSMAFLEVREFDIFRDSPPELNTALVVADPPWYEAESLGFLWCASALCRPGGYVAMSIPPVETRPGILEERARIEQAANTFGLRLSYIIPSLNSSVPASPILRQIVPGNILSTVSRRDPRRVQATVWTSGNRIFSCTGTRMLLRILDALVEQAEPAKVIAQDSERLSQSERFQIGLATFQLLNVVKCESDELRAHADAVRANRKLGPRSYPAADLERAG